MVSVVALVACQRLTVAHPPSPHPPLSTQELLELRRVWHHLQQHSKTEITAESNAGQACDEQPAHQWRDCVPGCFVRRRGALCIEAKAK